MFNSTDGFSPQQPLYKTKWLAQMCPLLSRRNDTNLFLVGEMSVGEMRRSCPLHCKKCLIKMTTSKGYCSFRAHWAKNKIIIHQLPHNILSFKKLAETLQINTSLYASICNYPVLNWIIAYELIQVGLVTSVCASSLKLDGDVRGLMALCFGIP